MYVMGLDVGYSNLKAVFGSVEGQTNQLVVPSGVGLESQLPLSLDGKPVQDGFRVLIDGEQWVAGVAHEDLQHYRRDMHENYPATKSYRALLYAALLNTNHSTIDLLVTGLPVDQYQQADRVDELKARLTGTHAVAPGRSVQVKQVTVLPQPAGAYAAIVDEAGDDDFDVVTQGIAIVIDPGYFSVDWVALNSGKIRSDLSGTSLEAMSVLIKAATTQIGKDYDARVGTAAIEQAIREGRDAIFVHSAKVNLAPYLASAAKNTAHAALLPMLESIRRRDSDINAVIITGGGTPYYRDAAKELFTRSHVLAGGDPVLANARGFFAYGSHHIKKLAA